MEIATRTILFDPHIPNRADPQLHRYSYVNNNPR